MADVAYDFEGETAIVTGGSSGIGRRLALGLGAAGATVLVADVAEDPGGTGRRPTHERIEADGGTAHYVGTDVADPDQVAAVVAAARDYGGVDVMVNNAGIIDRRGLLDVPVDAYDRVQAVDARGVFLGCKYAGADMVERGEPGVVLNTASVSSEFALHDHIAYDAAKGAVRMITRTAALDLAEHGVRVNAIAPGFTATDISEGGPDAVRETVAEGETLKPVPLGRAAEPEEVADAGLFLCTERASYVTGEMLFVDGGYQIL
jgi:NAD(P)-dependent dehydrogenase (short-subunit alcohol dehydrogenase family)